MRVWDLVGQGLMGGMDWAYILQYLPLYQQALLLTLKLAIIGIVISLGIGFLCNFIAMMHFALLKKVTVFYVAFFRNTPLVLQLFFMFYALPKLGVTLSSQTTALIGLSLFGGSYMSEALAAGISAVRTSQMEAGMALGLSRTQLARYVIFPQAISYSIPALGANAIFLVKETSIFSVIAVMELMNVTKSLIGMFYKTNESLFMLVVGYGIILVPLSVLLTLIERKVRYAEFGY